MTEAHKMTFTRPYLLRAIYDWVLDNACTPYIVVNAEYEDVIVPEQFVEDGKIILNVSDQAVQGLRLANDRIEFNARFSGMPMHIYVPIMAVVAIYAKENGRGMVFSEEEEGVPPDSTTGGSSDAGSGSGAGGAGKKGRPNLTIVK